MTDDALFRDRAIRMAEWELSIQQDDGSFSGGSLRKKIGKLVFDTGQIIFGLLSAFNHGKEFIEGKVLPGVAALTDK